MRGFASLTATVLFATMVVAGSTPGQAAYPERPVTVIVPWPAGGSTGIHGRSVSEFLDLNHTRIAASASARSAAGFPNKPITLIMPWPSGTGIDLWHRAMGEAVAKIIERLGLARKAD